jgi:hypothetical protein
MPNIHEIMSHVPLLLDNRVSIDEFGDWMLLYNVIWEGGADNATRQLAYAIQSSMTTFGTDHIDEETLRQQLAKAIKPFSSPDSLEVLESISFYRHAATFWITPYANRSNSM